MKTFFSPIRILVGYLSILALMASFSWGAFSLIQWSLNGLHFLLIYLSGYTLYRVLLKFGLSRPTRWEHRLITSLILFLLFDPLLPWWIFVVMGVVTEAVQRVVRLPTGPLVNPAAFGAVIISLVGYLPGWWGTSFSPRIPIFPGGMSIAAVLTIPIAGYVAWKYRKLLIPVVGMVTFAVTYWLIFQRNPLFLLLEGTLVFFFLVMVVEPKTSPVQNRDQLIYGGAVGILTVLGMKLALVEPYGIPLIICNLIFNLYKTRTWLKSRLFPQSQPINNPANVISK